MKALNRYKLNTKVSYGNGYFFRCFIYAKSIRGAKQTKLYKHYLQEFNDGKIVGLQIEEF
tara:strand:+ start:1389 stop:1568 length:180 start_codon:yes stop_codon:yes gene_type:complete